jgi:hypothetical protein
MDADDPGEIRYEQHLDESDPARQLKTMRVAIEETEVHLRYGIPRLKFIGWIIVILLVLILWRVWR